MTVKFDSADPDALASYCNFATIFRISPQGLTMDVPGIDGAQHAILQRLAWETVSRYSHAEVAAGASNQQ